MPEEIIATCNVLSEDRIRQQYENIPELAESIKEFGVIQPIVLQRTNGEIRLVAGGRRFTAIQLLGIKELRHGKEFVWRDEDMTKPEGQLRLQAVELEENLKRSDLTWSEICLGKQRLLDTMQKLKGVGGPGRGRTDGFSQKSLASMLGETEATTSRDLEMAAYVTKFPALAKLPTQVDAKRKIGLATTVAVMNKIGQQRQAKAAATMPSLGASALPKPSLWELYNGRFEDNIGCINSDTVDLVLTDLPYAAGLGDSTASHAAGLAQFSDSRGDIVDALPTVALESFRILRPNRFAVFFFGVSYYAELLDALMIAGFEVDDYWFIWHRNRTAPPSPSRYAKCYDPALICSKGTPTLLRPNLGNIINIASVTGDDRLHSAQKPVELMQHFILDMTAEGSTIVDLMAGSGTTGVAAVRNKRHCIMFELEDTNCTLIKSRMGAL